MNDEFYIGWEDQSPPLIGATVRRAVLGLLAGALAFALLLAAAQRLIGVSMFEWGHVKEFTGILKSHPYPHLLVPRPDAPGANAFSSYYLVKPFKFGLDPELCARFDGQNVRLRGTLIYRGSQTMIEAIPESIEAASTAPSFSPPAIEQLGRQTFVGEIVDSKCYLGVMNPGQLTTHRACAIRCISGGIPPILLVRQKDGPARYLLLVSPDGKPVNQRVLDLVAEPVEITGEVERHGELLVLRADPVSYRRVQ